MNADQVVYIITSPSEEAKQQFRIGGCTSKECLTSELKKLNKGRSARSRDQYEYVYTGPSSNYMRVLDRICDHLKLFRCGQSYTVPFNFLVNFVELVRENYEKDVARVKEILDTQLAQEACEQPFIPEPIDLSARMKTKRERASVE
jgi:hypothetical protein